MDSSWIIPTALFFLGWGVRGLFERLFISGKLIMLATAVERDCLRMLGRAEEHYWHSTTLLREAAEKTDKKNEMKLVLNSLKFTHEEWKKSAIEALHIRHPFPNAVKWYDWRTAMQTLEQEKLDRRNR